LLFIWHVSRLFIQWTFDRKYLSAKMEQNRVKATLTTVVKQLSILGNRLLIGKSYQRCPNDLKDE